MQSEVKRKQSSGNGRKQIGDHIDHLESKYGTMLEDIFGVFREVYERISGNRKWIEQISVKLETIEDKLGNHEHGTNVPPTGTKNRMELKKGF